VELPTTWSVEEGDAVPIPTKSVDDARETNPGVLIHPTWADAADPLQYKFPEPSFARSSPTPPWDAGKMYGVLPTFKLPSRTVRVFVMMDPESTEMVPEAR
jgi:hypothetical protein